MADPAPRRTFSSVLLAGVASAGLTTVAASHGWVSAHGDAAGLRVSATVSGSDVAPLALALSLVALASWGVVLVVSTRTRRVALVLGLLAGLGVLAGVGVGFSAGHDAVARALADKGATEVVGLSRSVWYWLTGLGALAQIAVQMQGLRTVGSWPTMSSRYDAPAGGTAGEPPVLDPATAEPIELWKALDEGQDPTREQPKTEPGSGTGPSSP